MDLNEPLPRLMRLGGMVARSVPSDETSVTHIDLGLVETYNRLRLAVADAAVELGVNRLQFDSELPELPPVTLALKASMMDGATAARTAATSLRSLSAYVEGLIATAALEERISLDKIQAAREAAKQPLGFR